MCGQAMIPGSHKSKGGLGSTPNRVGEAGAEEMMAKKLLLDAADDDELVLDSGTLLSPENERPHLKPAAKAKPAMSKVCDACAGSTSPCALLLPALHGASGVGGGGSCSGVG